jgi:hypothetical protein
MYATSELELIIVENYVTYSLGLKVAYFSLQLSF